MAERILDIDAISLSALRPGELLCMVERCQTLSTWEGLARYAEVPWSDAEPPVSVVAVLGEVRWSDLRQGYDHTLTLARLAAHATARAAREGRGIGSFPDFLNELLDTYDMLAQHRLGGDAADALAQDAPLPPQEGFASDRVEPRDLHGHSLGEGAPLAQHVGQFVAVDHDAPADVVGHAAPPASREARLPLWCCPRCGSCIGLIGRFFQAIGVPLHTCRKPAAPDARSVA